MMAPSRFHYLSSSTIPLKNKSIEAQIEQCDGHDYVVELLEALVDTPTYI